ncbi:MAG: metalloregulator ArsR/SmtB family transcription factor [Acidimicrobiales bacterium]|nr:metalloregulator ArsR/SmtB family transcription factor [Acidimicrobiales bacterium]
MSLPSDSMLDVLRAIGEPTRLRIVALLRHGELTVSDFTDILGQSQPRISRHLRLLADAGVVDKHREGSWVFFHGVETGPIAELVAGLLLGLDDHDPAVAGDLDRLHVVRQRRSAAAQEYFAGIAARWDEERSLHADDDEVDRAIAAIVGTGHRSLLDVGTGTGRMLQLLGRGVARVVGLDTSHSMLAVARANLDRAEVRGVDLRQGDVHRPPFPPDSFDLVVVHQVLHFLDDPARALREMARLLTPGGRLLIVDLAPHGLEFLRSEHAHRRLGFRADTVCGWLDQCELDVAAVRSLAPPASTDGVERLTVQMWMAVDRREPAAATTTATTTATTAATTAVAG